MLSSRTCRCVTLLSRHTQLSPSVETNSFTPRQERGQLTQRELVREGGGSSNWQEGLRVASTRRTSLEQVRRGRVQRVTGHVLRFLLSSSFSSILLLLLFFLIFLPFLSVFGVVVFLLLYPVFALFLLKLSFFSFISFLFLVLFFLFQNVLKFQETHNFLFNLFCLFISYRCNYFLTSSFSH